MKKVFPTIPYGSMMFQKIIKLNQKGLLNFTQGNHQQKLIKKIIMTL
jgi:hypothetical protein